MAASLRSTRSGSRRLIHRRSAVVVDLETAPIEDSMLLLLVAAGLVVDAAASSTVAGWRMEVAAAS